MKKLDKFLNWFIVFLMGVVLGVFLSGLLMSPTFHKPVCNEENKEKFDICKEQK